MARIITLKEQVEMSYMCLKDRLQAALDSLLELDTKSAADHISIAIGTINEIEAEIDKPEEERRPFVLVSVSEIPLDETPDDESGAPACPACGETNNIEYTGDWDSEEGSRISGWECQECGYCYTDLDDGIDPHERIREQRGY
jgi:Zn ribbon nucleic-acid-binding protein